MPPAASVATRCMSSGSMPACCAMARYSLPKVWSAMESPPEEEPVMPASTLIAMASEMRGLPGETLSTASRRMAKPAKLAMTAP